MTQTGQPPKLARGDRANFDTLVLAGKNGDLALVSAIRKSDGKAVALVCAIGRDEHGNIYPTPLASMVEGNPFEDFHDPVGRPGTGGRAASK
jgi:hypothetical protein